MGNRMTVAQGGPPQPSLTPVQSADGLEVRTVRSISEVPAEAWNRCADGYDGQVNPFLQWEFLHALEASGSAR